jgi:hypothetical protein
LLFIQVWLQCLWLHSVGQSVKDAWLPRVVVTIFLSFGIYLGSEFAVLNIVVSVLMDITVVIYVLLDERYRPAATERTS